ncbi:YceI family protein [Fulvivirga sp.]|uniref:YceI family protein n=1 Tax=Fulvivirga sp. TaxID=1931237 RepID=UPI0032EC8A08
MKTTKFLLASAAIVVLSAFTLKTSVNWKISDGYSIEFSGTDAEGVFKDLKGDVQFDKANPENSSFAFTVAVNSINTGKGMKNKHAVSDKWFDAEKYPNITFKSNSVSKDGGAYKVTGIMNIHGVAKEMTIPFSFNGNSFTSEFSVNRMDFGVGTMEGMSKKVSNEIKLDVTIPVAQ